MTFAQRRIRLTTHFSEGIPVVKRRLSVFDIPRHSLNIGSPVITACTIRFNIKELYFLPTDYIYAFCVDLRKKQRLFHYTERRGYSERENKPMRGAAVS